MPNPKTKASKKNRNTLKNKKREIANLVKHVEKGKNDPNYWAQVKKTTGSDEITYKGKTY
tara:strand:+ start:50 stop:229 length:180 start_codon:yes stop_codon:yes gene_type:complete